MYTGDDSIASHDLSRMDAPLAPFQRIKLHLRERLQRGDWPPGSLMPSEAELVRQFGVSRMTVNRALRELQAEGLVERVQGLGTFAAQLHRLSATITIRDMHEHVQSQGRSHRFELRLRRAEPAPAVLATRLGVKPGAQVFHGLGVHFDDEVPIQWEDRWVNPAAAPHFLDADFAAQTPTQYLLEVAPMWEAAYTIEASRPSAQEAAALHVDPAEPCLVLTRWTVSRGVPVTVVRLVHPGSRYQIEGEIKP
jgi:GntR family histidine utilization transcriptional repressor